VRDFRVTTIFEGTTEIHSLYPALAVARSWGREIEARGPVARLLTLARLGLRRGLVVADPSPPLAAALSAAAWSERLARRLISYGLRRYGSGIAKRELLLRRATHLSLSLFWIAASVERIRASHPDRAYPQEELDALAYLVEEAREVQERDGHRRESRRERIGERIMAAL
jgi:acyl-CoA dehydrogenase family protein 9